MNINKYEENNIFFTQSYIEEGYLLFNILQVQYLLSSLSDSAINIQFNITT